MNPVIRGHQYAKQANLDAYHNHVMQENEAWGNLPVTEPPSDFDGATASVSGDIAAGPIPDQYSPHPNQRKILIERSKSGDR